MPDIWNNRKRSEVMSLIRSHGNKATELRLIAIFRTHQITGWRRKQKLLGNPDFIFRRKRACIFVDGCFWHGCPKCYRRPGSNRKYWDEKVQKNRARDRDVNRKLRKLGWRVLRIWEHELTLKNEARLAIRIRKHIWKGIGAAAAS
jgi:DNA mismatch endonuclease, patch repair protein